MTQTRPYIICHRVSSVDGKIDHLICVVSEQVPTGYLSTLRERYISFIVSGNLLSIALR